MVCCLSPGFFKSVVSYCMATRPEGECNFEDQPRKDLPQDEAAAAYGDWRRSCLHRCFFGTPDLNVVRAAS